MAILLATLLVFVGLMLTFQLIYFEISRKRALRVNNLVWFEQFNRPFNYTGTASMVVLCIICFMIGGTEATFMSAQWFLELIIFVACGVIADAVVQFIIIKYGKFRCRQQIKSATTLMKEIEDLKRGDEDDYGYEVSAPLYDEVSITKSYVHPEDHLAFMTVDKGQFVKDYKDYPAATFDIEPYSETSEVEATLEGLPVKATKLTESNLLPFKDERIDVLMDQFSNYDKNEVLRVLKPNGTFIVNQNGSDNLQEFLSMYMPFKMKGAWDMNNCAMTLADAGFEVVETKEDRGYIRFHNLRQIQTYFRKVAPEVAENVAQYKSFYMHALDQIKQNTYFQLTTYRFLVVAKKNF